MLLNRWQKLIARLNRIDIPNISWITAEAYMRGDRDGFTRAMKEHPDCQQCAYYLNALSAYCQKHPGKYAVYHKNMERKKAFVTCESDPETQSIPSIERL